MSTDHDEIQRKRAAKSARRKRDYSLNQEREKANMKRWRLKNPEAHARARRASRLKLEYGITVKDFNVANDRQSGKCLICLATPKGRLHVDHDHVTGRFRGLLCGSCNRAIGLMKDDPIIITRMAMYVSRGVNELSYSPRRMSLEVATQIRSLFCTSRIPYRTIAKMYKMAKGQIQRILKNTASYDPNYITPKFRNNHSKEPFNCWVIEPKCLSLSRVQESESNVGLSSPALLPFNHNIEENGAIAGTTGSIIHQALCYRPESE